MDNTFCKSSFLHGIAFAACVFAYCKCLAIDQTTQWWQVPPTSTVHQVGIDAGLGNCDCHGKRYAMFIIPLNEQLEDKFVTFELKASTNNFSAIKEFDRIAFWSVSTTADIASLTNSVDNAEYIQDGMRLYIANTPSYYNKFATNVLEEGQYQPSNPYVDIRRYQRISNSLAVSDGRATSTHEPYYVNSYVVIVEPNMCRTHVPASWLRNNNDELIWTYVRAYADGNRETDPDGRILWHPIAPVKWFKDLPKWADHDAIDTFDHID